MQIHYSEQHYSIPTNPEVEVNKINMTPHTEILLILHKSEDELQSKLENLIKHGWPNDRKPVPKELKLLAI